jgi:hypothetical protein
LCERRRFAFCAAESTVAAFVDAPTLVAAVAVTEPSLSCRDLSEP